LDCQRCMVGDEPGRPRGGLGRVQDMFDLGSDKNHATDVAAPAKDEAKSLALSHCGSRSFAPFSIVYSPDQFWTVARVCDKYEVSERSS